VVPIDSEECHIVLEDITEYKQSEQELRVSEGRIVHSPDCYGWILVVDAKGHLLEINETYCKNERL